eukprot:CAMPEP_0179051924 /NCGR_PEP_ID=MMETSP0796-20121207/21493_1 /TAXON_ID=73915 /ORGANISM="Pyrodinium bahamense, Strain pbaha01" /LENGTH=49 /DNA_ID= /DNA_START= /DNA_END= /DNA_ORIENTATION=
MTVTTWLARIRLVRAWPAKGQLHAGQAGRISVPNGLLAQTRTENASCEG